MDNKTKRKAFEYWLTRILEWGSETKPSVFSCSFTRLKALKLLFFSAAIKNEKGEDLLDVFDNFYALPNGPVESDIYNYITSDTLMFYSFKGFILSRKKEYCDSELSDYLQKRIDESIIALRKTNEDIVTYSAEQLVNLSHTWFSWRNSIQMAKALDKGSYRMNPNVIKNNPPKFAI